MEGRHPDHVHEEAKKLLQEARETAECVGGIYLPEEAIFKAQEASMQYDHLIQEYGPEDRETPILKDFEEIREEAIASNLFTSYLEILASDYESARHHANNAMALSDRMDVEYQKANVLQLFALDQEGLYDTKWHWKEAEKYKKCLEKPEKARVINLLGRLNQAKGKWKDAKENFEDAANLDPSLELAVRDFEDLYNMEETFNNFMGNWGVAKEPKESKAEAEIAFEEPVPALEIIADGCPSGDDYMHRNDYFYRRN